MTCPHCGADASAGQKFCPKCSRLVDSPLLKIKQQIDAAREEIRKDLNAYRVAVSLPAQPPPHYQVRVDAPRYSPPTTPPPPSPYKYAPHPSQTPALTRPPSDVPRETILRSQERNQKNQRKRKRDQDGGAARAQHTDTTHRFDPIAEAKKAMAQAKTAEAAGPAPERFTRPAAFTVLALLDLIGAGVMFYTAMQLTMQYPEPRPPIIEFSRILAGATAFLFVVTAFGMLKLHPYGRFFQRLFLLPVMLWVPIGTIYGVAVWLYLGTAVSKLYFSGRSPRSLDAKQLASWRTADKASPVFAFLIFAFGFIPAIAYATFISGTLPLVFNEAERMFPQAFSQLTQTPALEGGAADAAAQAAAEEGTPAPSASSTDGAPEGDPASIAVVQIKQMQRAQAAYASLNEGYYDRLECVLTPSMCIRNGDERNKAVLLDRSFIPPRRHGYTFLLNTSGEPAVRSQTASPTSMRGYSYRAIPEFNSGDRVAYCGDETGMICAFDARTADGGNFGRCPEVCRPIE